MNGDPFDGRRVAKNGYSRDAILADIDEVGEDRVIWNGGWYFRPEG